MVRMFVGQVAHLFRGHFAKKIMHKPVVHVLPILFYQPYPFGFLCRQIATARYFKRRAGGCIAWKGPLILQKLI